MQSRRFYLAVSAVLLMSSLSCCGFIDSKVVWKSGRYGLIWIDDPKQVQLCFDAGRGSWLTLVDPQVFSVGADERFVVVKQHPNGDRGITNYYIVSIRADSAAGESQHTVEGPFSEAEFTMKSKVLQLPVFTKFLDSLN